MNILTIIMLLIILACALNGYRRGFVRVFTSMIFFIAISVLVYFLNPYISDFLKENTPVYEYVQQGCKNALEDKIKAGEQESQMEQKKYIEDLNIPEVLKKELIRNNNDSIYEGLGISGFTDYIASYMADLILKLITFVVTVILANIIWRMIVKTLYSVSRLPGIHGLNRYMGMAFGAVQGLLIVWVLFLVITIFGQSEGGQKLLVMIHESTVLEYLYNINIFLKIVIGQ